MLKRFFTILFTGAAVLSASVALAQNATIKGKVSDESGEGLAGANVVIESTNLGASTNSDGEYTFNVPASRLTGTDAKLTARFIGYKHQTFTITLSAGSINQDFTLAEDVLQMDAIIVTGVIDDTPKTKMAFSVGSVSGETLEHAPAGSPESALRGKVAGVKIVQASGQPGSSASVQLRAPLIINASGRTQDPLYIIDGVIVDASVSGSPLSDIPTEDIASMEVVKGAAGASLYGSRAANGVVVINTKRGNNLGLGQTKIRIRNEIGFNNLERDVPLSTHHNFAVATTNYTDSEGNAVAVGDFINADGNYVDPRDGGGRILDEFAPNISFMDNDYKWIATGDIKDKNGNFVAPSPLDAPFDHMERFFEPGIFMSNSVSISRNMEHTNFLVSFSNRDENGIIIETSGLNRKAFRLNVDHKIGSNLNFGVSTLISQSSRDLVGNTASDGFTGGGTNPFYDLNFQSADVDLFARDEDGELYVTPDPLAVEINPLIPLYAIDRQNLRLRNLGSASLRWQPDNSFNMEAAASYDRSDRNGGILIPVNTALEENANSRGSITRGIQIDKAFNASLTAQYSKAFGDLTTRFKVRALTERTELEWASAAGENFATVGIKSAGSTENENASSGQQSIRSEGVSGMVAFDYKDRYIVDFLARRDGSSLFGIDERWATYYRSSLAYRMSEESWWPLGSVEEFKLRASYGTAGNRPNFGARFETWNISDAGPVKGNLGNKKLKPEFVTELELGLDATFLERFSFEFSYAQSNAEDQLLNAPLPGYAGYRRRWINAGTLESDIFEASLNASLKQTRDFSWTSGLVFDRTRSKITKLDIPEYSVVLGGVSAFRIKNNESFGALYGHRWMTSKNELAPGVDASEFAVNSEGYLVWVGADNSVTDGIAKELWGTKADLTDDNGVTRTYNWGIPVKYQDASGSEFHKIGDTTPDFNIGFSNNIQYKGLTIYALMDMQFGGDLYSNTTQWGMRETQGGAADQSGKSDGEKKPTLYYQTLYNVNGVNSHYVLPGQYAKLRELSIRYSFNRKQMSGVFGGFFKKVTVGIVGRNLLTFVKDGFVGFDPEVGVADGAIGSAVVGRIAAFGYPNFRTFSGQLEIEL